VNSVTNKRRTGTGSDKARVARWRAASLERYRDYMRDLMRKRRAEAKASSY
jgi:hypothetical protein